MVVVVELEKLRDGVMELLGDKWSFNWESLLLGMAEYPGLLFLLFKEKEEETEEVEGQRGAGEESVVVDVVASGRRPCSCCRRVLASIRRATTVERRRMQLTSLLPVPRDDNSIVASSIC